MPKLQDWQQTAKRARFRVMAPSLKGLVKGNTIVLDESVPRLEGKRVLVALEPMDMTETEAEPCRLLEAWQAWIASGPEGPIEDDGEPTIP